MPPYSSTVWIAGMQLRDIAVMTCAQPPLIDRCVTMATILGLNLLSIAGIVVMSCLVVGYL